jgi:hypothetical protein
MPSSTSSPTLPQPRGTTWPCTMSADQYMYVRESMRIDWACPRMRLSRILLCLHHGDIAERDAWQDDGDKKYRKASRQSRPLAAFRSQPERRYVNEPNHKKASWAPYVVASYPKMPREIVRGTGQARASCLAAVWYFRLIIIVAARSRLMASCGRAVHPHQV